MMYFLFYIKKASKQMSRGGAIRAMFGPKIWMCFE